MITYNKIQFTKGLDCIAYHEIEDGQLIRILDENMNELDISDIITESHVIEEDCHV